MEFTPFPKIARLNREIVITEKIDGTNASIFVEPVVPGHMLPDPHVIWENQFLRMKAGSRTRWIMPGDDNYGFAAWAQAYAEELAPKLGPGLHFGEWWGYGIQRGYGLPKGDRRFSLFNTNRWDDVIARPTCCEVVPTLWRGDAKHAIGPEVALELLRKHGSFAEPGFLDPEGIMVYHTAANLCFKATLKGDEMGKSQEAHMKKEQPPRPPKNPAVGGRRKGQVEIGFADRRKK